jgi:hypothetical protein
MINQQVNLYSVAATKFFNFFQASNFLLAKAAILTSPVGFFATNFFFSAVYFLPFAYAAFFIPVSSIINYESG